MKNLVWLEIKARRDEKFGMPQNSYDAPGWRHNGLNREDVQHADYRPQPKP